MSPRVPAVLVTAVVLTGCGSSSDSKSTSVNASDFPKTETTAKPLPKSCNTNADGVVKSLHLETDRGLITAGKLGDRVRFHPKTDINRGQVKVGTPVLFTFKKNSAGGTATCIIAQG